MFEFLFGLIGAILRLAFGLIGLVIGIVATIFGCLLGGILLLALPIILIIVLI